MTDPLRAGCGVGFGGTVDTPLIVGNSEGSLDGASEGGLNGANGSFSADGCVDDGERSWIDVD